MRHRLRSAHAHNRLYSHGIYTAAIIIASLFMSAGCGRDGSPLAPSTATPAPAPTTPTSAVTFDVTGTVRSTADGGGVAGARLEVTSGPQPADPTTTDAQGAYMLTGLVAGTYAVRVTHDAFESTTTPLVLSGHRTLDVDLTPAGAPASDDPAPARWVVSGTVTNGATATPVVDARVMIAEGDARGVDALTDDHGRYELGPLTAGSVVLRVEANGFVPRQTSLTVDRSATVDISLSPVTTPAPSGPTVSGRAVDVLTGTPLAGVHVQIDGGGEASSGADGAFSVVGTSGPTERVTLSSPATVDRQTRIVADGDPTLSLIPRAFNLDAFDQMLRSRGGLLRWVEAPRLVVERRTLAFTNTTDMSYVASSATMTEADADALVADLVWALPLLTGGQFRDFAAIDIRSSDEGAAVSITDPGAIVVARFEGLEAAIAAWGFGRWAWNGAGEVQAGALMLDQAFETSGSPYRRSLRAHELGHTLGYDHVTSESSVMHVSGRVAPTSFDRDATTIAFRRPPLNASPDIDPDEASISRRTARATLQWEGRR